MSAPEPIGKRIFQCSRARRRWRQDLGNGGGAGEHSVLAARAIWFWQCASHFEMDKPRMHLPDYERGSIVNLLSAIQSALGVDGCRYAPLPHLDPHELARARHIVLIVIDGLGYRCLLQHRANTLRQHLVARITSVFPSTTAAAITTFFTGTAPQQHALTGWFTYFKELGAVITPLPFKPRMTKGSSGEVGVQARHLFDHPSMFEKIQRRCYIVLPRHIVDSDYTLALSGGAARVGYKSLVECFKSITEILRTNGEPAYVYAYWPELDTTAHAYGIGSDRVAMLIEQLDSEFARFLKAVRNSGATVIVTADHGIIDSQPQELIRLEEHPQLAETLVLPLCGEPRVAFCYVHPHKTGAFERYVRARLSRYAWLMSSEDLIARGYFGLGEPHPRLLDRIGHYALVMKDRYVIKDWLLDEKRYVQVGVHGGVSEEEMYVPLILVNSGR